MQLVMFDIKFDFYNHRENLIKRNEILFKIDVFLTHISISAKNIEVLC